MKTHSKFMLTAICFILAATVCQATQIDLRTGVTNGTNSLIGINNNDDTWTVKKPGASGFIPALATSQNVWGWQWMPNTVRFLSTSPTTMSLPGTYTYRMEFQYNEPCNEISTVTINLSTFGAQQKVTTLNINGWLYPLNYLMFNWGAVMNTWPVNTVITLSASDLVTGTNYIEIDVDNGVQGSYYSSNQGLFIDGFLNINHVPNAANFNFTTAGVFCAGSPLVVDGSSSSGLISSHYWTIEECNSNMTVTQGAPMWTGINNPTAGKPGLFDVMNAWRLPCNKYYRIRLYVKDVCNYWYNSMYHMVFITCGPVIDLRGSTNVICKGTPGGISVAVSGTGNYTMNVVELPGNNSVYSGPANVAFLVWPTTTTTYQITVPDPNYVCPAIVNFTVNVFKCKPFIDVDVFDDNNDHFTASAKPREPGEEIIPGFEYAWFISEIDPGTEEDIYTIVNPSCWQNGASATNIFDGADAISNNYQGEFNDLNCTGEAGMFLYDHTYRITRAAWSDLFSYTQESVIITPEIGKTGHAMSVTPDNNAPDMRKLLKTKSSMKSVQDIQLNVYPNPGSGVFNIATAADVSGTIEVYDAIGNKVSTFSITQGASNHTLDLSGYARGIYLLHMISGDKAMSRKIILQ
jgi:ribosomal protein S19